MIHNFIKIALVNRHVSKNQIRHLFRKRGKILYYPVQILLKTTVKLKKEVMMTLDQRVGLRFTIYI